MCIYTYIYVYIYVYTYTYRRIHTHTYISCPEFRLKMLTECPMRSLLK